MEKSVEFFKPISPGIPVKPHTLRCLKTRGNFNAGDVYIARLQKTSDNRIQVFEENMKGTGHIMCANLTEVNEYFIEVMP